MIKRLLFIFLATLTGIGIGVYRISDYENSELFFRNGVWSGSKQLPLGENDLLTAQITVFALFALPGSEAIYLFAKRDEAGNLMHSGNDYEIQGNLSQFRCKYWSITAYGRDLFLIPNTAARYSFNNTNLETDSAGNFTIRISNKAKAGNWLPSPDNARFGLVLRVYRGEREFIEHLDRSPLPEIKMLHQ